MAMLAERRRKQKWTLNPRGKDWSDDTNKFGQKMLEKMGWSSGKGLGAKEDGMTDHVKVSYKNDSKGMGFKESSDQWTEHEDQFSNLLKSLGNTVEPNDHDLSKTKSLEEKSQKSRARVHYHKFTRGKDLSRYSEKDLANIFGRKELKKQKPVEATKEESSESSEGDNKSTHLIQAGSMVDYFKKKIPNFGVQNGMQVGRNGVLQKVESDSDDERPAFGFGFQTNDTVDEKPVSFTGNLYAGFQKAGEENKESYELKQEENVPEKKKKKKKRKEAAGFVSYIEEAETPTKKRKLSEESDKVVEKDIETKENEAMEEVSTPKTKKRKRKNIQNEENNQCEEIIESIQCEEIVENPYEVKRKKKKAKLHIEEGDTPMKKSKKVHKENKGGIANGCYENLNFDENVVSECQEEENNLHVEENIYEVKPKKKKKAKHQEVVEIPTKKSKKKKHKEVDSGISNGCFEEIDVAEETIEVPENPYEVKPEKKSKKKKKHKNKDSGIENECFEGADSSIDNSQIENPYEVKSSKPEESGIDNLALNLTDDLMLNVTFEPVKTITPVRPILHTPKPTKLKRRKSVRFSDVTEERIIPNREDNRLAENGFVNNGFESKTNETNTSGGIVNGAFDNLQTEVEIMEGKMESYEAEVENDINEGKAEVLIGEAGVTKKNAAVKEGVRLSFHKVKFGNTADFFRNEKVGSAKKGYKHLIKGDIIVKFKESNLHEVIGYAVPTVRETLV